MPIVSCRYASESLTLKAKSLKKKKNSKTNQTQKQNKKPPKNNQTLAVYKKNELSNYITVSINADQK